MALSNLKQTKHPKSEFIMIEVKFEKVNVVSVIKLAGNIDAQTAPKIQEKVLLLAQPESKILLDMRKVLYLSSAGLRVLLLLERQATAKKGNFVLVGLSAEIRDIMFVTGFLDFFNTCDTLELGLARVRQICQNNSCVTPNR